MIPVVKAHPRKRTKKPSFGARPNTKDPDFDFKKELERLPFELNIGDAPLTCDQQARLIDVIYSHTEVFSLFDGDLGFCDVLKHSIPTTTDKTSLFASSANSCTIAIRGKKMSR